jgi:hypothetical protein
VFTSSTDADIFDGGWSVDVPIEADGERPCVWLLYRFWDKFGRLLYIGQTRQDAIERWMQHVKTQPWAYLIRRMEADPLEFSSEAEVRVAERNAIHAELPFCNKEHNLGNPNRWVFDEHPVRVQRRGGRTVRQPLAPVRRRLWTGERAGVAATAVIWLGVAGTFSWDLGSIRLGPVAAVLLFWAAWVKTRRIRPRRKSR